MPIIEVDDKELRGAAIAFRNLDADIRKETAKAVRTTLTPLWRKIVATRISVAEGVISSKQDALAGPGVARFTAAGSGSLAAYTRGRPLSGGLDNSQWYAIEFGTTRAGYSGTRLPRRYQKGRIIYKGVKSFAPAAQRVYLGVVMDVLRDTGVLADG